MNKHKIKSYFILMRLNHPSPILLMLWPILTSLILASKKIPNFKYFIIFIINTIIMRTFGCIINDIIDIDFDKYIPRTNNRPLINKKIKIKNALIICFTLIIISFIFILFILNFFTVLLSCIALLLTIFYPFCKRFFLFPQLILGLVFNFGILISFSAIQDSIPVEGWIFYLSIVFWTIAYDTIYAIADKEFDLKIGIKSSTILFGNKIFIYILLFNLLFIFFLIILGIYCNFNIYFYLYISTCAIILINNHYYLHKIKNINNYINVFYNNHWIGLIIFISIIIQYLK